MIGNQYLMIISELNPMKKIFLITILTACIGMQYASAQWAANVNNIYNTNTGFVGIGNNSPTTLLYVAKNMTEPCITVRNMGGNGGATYAMVDDASGAFWKFKATNTGGFKIRDNSNALDVITIESGSFANAIYIKSTDNIGIGTSAPNASAVLDISSTTKGFLAPRMNHAQLEAISSPTEGLMVYCTDCAPDESGRVAMYIAGAWYMMSIDDCLSPPDDPLAGTSEATSTSITWVWNSVEDADGYKWSATNDYSAAQEMGGLTSKTETGLEPGTSYTRYVWSYNGCGHSAAVELTITTTNGE
jgi:hypothetical protein